MKNAFEASGTSPTDRTGVASTRHDLKNSPLSLADRIEQVSHAAFRKAVNSAFEKVSFMAVITSDSDLHRACVWARVSGTRAGIQDQSRHSFFRSGPFLVRA